MCKMRVMMTRLYTDVLFSGSYTALLTPFDAAGAFDAPSFEHLVETQIKQGTHGLVPVGTTGESPTLTHAEHDQVIELCVQVAGGRVPVVAGAGSNSTAEAVRLSRHAEAVGADAVLIVTPYYNKPTQAGLHAHFTAIAEAISIPIIIYDIPGRSIVRLEDVVLADLARHKNIVGIKDATADCARPTQLRGLIKGAFCQFSGDDGTMLPHLAAGGHGCISVTSNIAPKLCADLHKAWAAGDWARAFALHQQLMPVHAALSCETNPGPVKYAASLLGLASAKTRLPLAPLSKAAKQKVRAALLQSGFDISDSDGDADMNANMDSGVGA